jgi:hypothetical protein
MGTSGRGAHTPSSLLAPATAVLLRQLGSNLHHHQEQVSQGRGRQAPPQVLVPPVLLWRAAAVQAAQAVQGCGTVAQLERPVPCPCLLGGGGSTTQAALTLSQVGWCCDVRACAAWLLGVESCLPACLHALMHNASAGSLHCLRTEAAGCFCVSKHVLECPNNTVGV